MYSLNINSDSKLIHFLENYHEPSNILKRTLTLSALEKILVKKNNMYSKISFLEDLIKSKSLKKILRNFIVYNQDETKKYLILNIFDNDNVSIHFLERYSNVICELFNYNYNKIMKFYILVVKDVVSKYSTKGQNVELNNLEDLRSEFKNENIIKNLTDFCIMIFFKIELPKYENSLDNKFLSFDTLFKLIIKLLDLGYINNLEELHSRIIERDDNYMDIFYFNSLIIKIKDDITYNDHLNDDEIKEKEHMIVINNNLIDEYNYLNSILDLRIYYLKKQTTFYSNYITNFIDWLFNISNLLLEHKSFNYRYSVSVIETILNIVITHKKIVITNGIDLNNKKINSFLIFIKNIHSNKLIKNPDILIKSLDLLKLKLNHSFNYEYYNSLNKNYKFWCKNLILSCIRLKSNKSFTLVHLPFITSILNYFLANNNKIFVYLKHCLKHELLNMFIHLNIKVLKYYLKKITFLFDQFYKDKNIDYFSGDNEDLKEYKEYYKNIEIIFIFLNYLHYKNHNIVVEYENRNIYFEFLDLFINDIVKKNYGSIKVKSFIRVIRYITVLIEYIFKFYIDKVVSIYSSEFIDFKKDNWIEYIYFIKKLDIKMFHLNINTIHILDTLIQKNKNRYSKLDDKFIDPITQTTIEEPVFLSNNIIVDKYVICKHLIENEYNPFNRDYLTIDILNKFNNQQDNLKKIFDFKLEFREQMQKIKY